MKNGIIDFRKISGFIFDMDGVLTDSEPIINESAIKTLKEYGISAKKDDFTPFIGGGDTKYIQGVAELYGIKYTERMKERMYEIYFEIVKDKIKTFPGVKELLQYLQNQNKKIAVASAADKNKVEINLKSAKIDTSIFNVIITGDDIKKKKPDPEIYNLTILRLGISPDESLVIEDAINGIISAKKAGAKCVAVTNSFKKEILKQHNPDLIVNNLYELKNILEKYQT